MHTLGAHDGPQGQSDKDSWEATQARWQAEQDAQEEAEEKARAAFIAHCRMLDPSAQAGFAYLITDPTTGQKRTQTLGEVMHDSLDYSSGPQHEEMYQIFLALAYGNTFDLRRCARELIERMAKSWAHQHAEVA